MRRTLSCLAALLVLAAGAWAGPPRGRPSPQDLMIRLVERPPDYTGRRLVVVWSTSGSRAMEFAETRQGARLRLEVCPTGQSGPALLLGDRTGWLVPQPSRFQRLERVSVPEAQSRRRLDQAFRSHEWRVEGESSVAGRPAWVVVARATHPGGFRHVFWVDRDYPVVLQREKHDHRGRLVYRSTFVSLEYQAPLGPGTFQEALQPAAAAAGADGADFAPSVPDLPLPGFRTESSVRLPSSLVGRYGHQTVYSDGLESVSLFQFPGNRPVRLRGASTARLAGCPVWTSQAGATNLASWSDGRRSYLAVSALPLQTLEPLVGRLAPSRPSEAPGLAAYLRRGWNRVLSLVGRAD